MSTHILSGVGPLTESQRDVVLADGTNLLVGAGAGSGKTSTVVQTICHLLGATVVDEEGTAYRATAAMRLADIAAITFTNQAAADLKRKLRQALKQSGLRSIAADVDSARIGTIHSFCGMLLREFALRAGLPPSVSILDDGAAQTLASACAEAAFLEVVSTVDAAQLAPLTAGRRTRDIIAAIVQLAENAELLAAYAPNRTDLRDHERLLLDIALRAVDLRHQELDKRSEYDFDRMICATRDLLRDHTDVRRAVQKQIRVLIVDEFQDVDPAQRDIALLLGGLIASDPAPTRLLLIGDPKQSIFRFRRADVTLWNDVARGFASRDTAPTTTNARAVSVEGRALELSENFRSRKGILAFVDGVFGHALETPVSDDGTRMPYEVAYTPLSARSVHADGDRCVELLCVPADDSGKAIGTATARELESQAVAKRVQELLANGHSYGDIALLLSSWSDVAVYEGALRRAGIPAYVLRASGFWESREIIDCVLALHAIRDQHDPVADVASLVGFLKSPFVGVRDDTLLAMSQHPQGWRAALQQEPRERELLNRAGVILARFGALRDRLPLGEFVQRLVLETGFLAAHTVHDTQSAQAIANIRKFIRLAGDAREASLGEWLRDIGEAREREDQVPEERLYRERADVVTITSIHSAKGLEWPIVFWCDVMRESPKYTDALIRGRDSFRWKDVRLVNEKGAVVDDVYDALRAALELEQQAESRRLWYVASTRAKVLLVLSGVRLGKVSRGGDSVSGLLVTHFADALAETPLPQTIAYHHADGSEYALVVQTTADAESGIENVDVRKESEWLPRDTHMAPPPAVIPVAAGRTRLSATQLMRFAESRDAWWRTYAFGLAVRDANTDDRVLIGNIVHHVLQNFNFELSDIEELIDAAIAHHDADHESATSPVRYRATVRDLIDRAVSHPRWRELVSHATTRRELQFTRVLPDGSTIDGALDLAAITDGMSRIVDVKTGGGNATDAARRYAIQAAVYVEAAQAITGGRPATFELLRVAEDESVPVPVDVARVAELVATLRKPATRNP